MNERELRPLRNVNRGKRPLEPIHYATPVASAQVKSAVLLAGLWAREPVSVTEPSHSRDHSERMLRKFGVTVESRGLTVTVVPGPLEAASVDVPGDISSAAFLLVAGAIVRDGRVAIADVGVNPTRTGVLDALDAMGATVAIGDRIDGDEPAATLTVTPSELRGTTIAGDLIPRLIDELPVLAVAAALARGVTRVTDAAELRVKESDRIAAIGRELGKMGVRVTERPDGFDVEGGATLRGATVASGGDHRLAMALAVAGLRAEGETVVEDTACIRTSFPGFVELINTLAGGDVLVEEA